MAHAPRSIFMDDNYRNEVVPFCAQCFADDLGGDSGMSAEPGFCMNCGGGDVIKTPRWAIDSIRRNASFVGKRSYPHQEDRERHNERLDLLALVKEFPGRTGERDINYNGDVIYRVTQQLPQKGSNTQVCIMHGHDSCTLTDAIREASKYLPYVPEHRLPKETET